MDAIFVRSSGNTYRRQHLEATIASGTVRRVQRRVTFNRPQLFFAGALLVWRTT